jgi:predicted HTH domain antitoxin
MSRTINIVLSDDIFLCMQKDAPSLAAEMRLAAAVKWYECGVLSQEKAAEVAGISRAEFLANLARFHVSPFQETKEDILASVRRD